MGEEEGGTGYIHTYMHTQIKLYTSIAILINKLREKHGKRESTY